MPQTSASVPFTITSNSKEAIYATLLDWVFEAFGNALDRLVRDIADPAEVISVCVRHTLLRATREPVWGQFLVREGFSGKVLERGLGPAASAGYRERSEG